MKCHENLFFFFEFLQTTIFLIDTGRTFDNGGNILRFWRRLHELEGIQNEQRIDSFVP